jgi:chromosomal replication initiator protein
MKEPWFSIECEIYAHLKPPPSIRDIQRAVCGRFAGVTVDDVTSERMAHEFIMPRQIAMFLSSALTKKSAGRIGAAFGDRDPSTIAHGIRKIERLSRADIQLRRLITSIGDEFGRAV